MSKRSPELLSIVVPLYNEQASLPNFHASLLAQLEKLHEYSFELIYCNDGSNDQTLRQLKIIATDDPRLRVITLSRNFGKEIATTAGIQAAQGKATLTIDADGQHPVELIPQFINRWKEGAKVVIGLRPDSKSETLVKRVGSRLFYRLFNRVTGMELKANATDYRLIDEAVQQDFARMTEHNRVARGLIDWLGYERSYIEFQAKLRLRGSPSYSISKLFKLAIDTIISFSSSPLYVTACIGAIVLPLSMLLGVVMLADKLLGDPFHWQVTGGAYISVLVLFLIGVLLMSQGFIGLYLSHIHSETQNRPLYIIDREASLRL